MGSENVGGTSKSLMPIIERSFTLSQNEEVRATLAIPVMVSPRLWRCSYRTAWPTHELAHDAYGLDGVQALLLALEVLHRKLLVEAAYRQDVFPSEDGLSTLTWLGQCDLGLPPLGTVNLHALHAHLLKDAREDGRDLDHIILRECVVKHRKVAMVAGTALIAVGANCRSARLYGDMGDDEPDLLLEAVLARISALVADGVLAIQGDLVEPRYSEVRRLQG